jgi:hypothetical protein
MALPHIAVQLLNGDQETIAPRELKGTVLRDVKKEMQARRGYHPETQQYFMEGLRK